MPDLQTALVFLIVGLLGMLGKFLKESKFFPDEMIPNILGVFGAVGVHQSYRQTVKRNDTNNTEDK